MAAFKFGLLLLLQLYASLILGSPVSDHASRNATRARLEVLKNRSQLSPRQAYFKCTDVSFESTLATALDDAYDIIAHLYDAMGLLMAMYDTAGTGELLATKQTRAGRTFDEHNIWLSYNLFVSKVYFGPGNAKNQAGYSRFQSSYNVVKNMLSQYENYIEGIAVEWEEDGYPKLNIYCGDLDLYSETNEIGQTFAEANPPRTNPEGEIWWISQRDGAEVNRRIWAPRLLVCSLDGSGGTRFGGVPVGTTVSAYVHNAIYGLVDESMVLCPSRFAAWNTVQDQRTAAGLTYRDLHVALGEELTDAQTATAETLLSQADFTTATPIRGVHWLGDFFVSTLIHEGTHTEAFAGKDKQLIDVKCYDENGKVTGFNTLPTCLAEIAKGTNGLDADGNPQGHRDAEAIALLAMTTYVNSVYWYSGWRPKARDTWDK